MDCYKWALALLNCLVNALVGRRWVILIVYVLNRSANLLFGSVYGVGIAFILRLGYAM